MRYMGSKARLANDIATRINNIAVSEGITNYYEPFMGGCSVGELVTIQNRYFSDISKELVALFKKMQTDMWEYKYITREEWHAVVDSFKAQDNLYPDWYYGWVGIGCAFRGRPYEGYGGIYTDKATNRLVNPQIQVYNSILKEIPLIKTAQFRNCSYLDIGKPYHSIIYCDAPYIGTTAYIRKGSFDYEQYYKWLIEMSQDNLVLISEYIMPSDKFTVIDSWSLSKSIGSGNTDDETSIENLYYVHGGYLTDKYFEENDEYDF